MELVKTVAERLQKYEFASIEEAEYALGDMWQVSQVGPDLCARAGFGNHGFEAGEGIELTLPGKTTLVTSYGARMRLTEGFAIPDIVGAYSKIFNRDASILLLRYVTLDTRKRTLTATVTLDFDNATHVLFIQPLQEPNRKMPRKTKRNAIFHVQRVFNPDYYILYIALPITYHEKYVSNLEVLRDHRRYRYAQHLTNNYQMKKDVLQLGKDAPQPDTSKSSKATPDVSKEEVSKFRHLWMHDYGDKVVESPYRLIHFENAYEREFNYVLLPDGRLLSPQLEGQETFANASVSEYQVWQAVPERAAILKFYSACCGKIMAYDFIKHPKDGVYTERMMFTISCLQRDIQKIITSSKWNDEAIGLNLENIPVQHSKTWSEQIAEKFQSTEAKAECAAQTTEEKTEDAITTGETSKQSR